MKTNQPIRKLQTHLRSQYFPLGTTRVTYVFQDFAGNTQICSFDITLMQGNLNVSSVCLYLFVVILHISDVKYLPRCRGSFGHNILTKTVFVQIQIQIKSLFTKSQYYTYKNIDWWADQK